MNCIKSKGQFVKVIHGKPSLVSDLRKATVYKAGEAENYIATQVAKKYRDDYEVVEIDNQLPNVADNDISSAAKCNCLLKIDKINKQYTESLKPVYQELENKLTYYNDAIQDIAHYIRQPDFKANACLGYKIFKKEQQLQRERVAIKREMERIKTILEINRQAIDTAKDFEYKAYKPRVFANLGEILK